MNRFEIEQHPLPGTHRALCRGDRIEFRLRHPSTGGGAAWLRTNLGSAAVSRAGIIAAVDEGRPRLARDWRDLPMTPSEAEGFSITVPLTEVGHFEAKTYFMAQPDAEPEWPLGDNVSLSVAPAQTVGANTIYNAFVRQFGPNRPPSATRRRDFSGVVDASRMTVMAPSGTFRDLMERLDFIIGELGCRYLLLLPVHPVPAVYGRMGLYGSPYAATDFFAVEPGLARFDRKATPMDQFLELVDAVHARQAYVMMDIAINHCGWAAAVHARHPEWIVREADCSIRSPGAWGVTWHDLTEINFENRAVWRYMAEVFLFWCRRGVDGFRCDAGYMIPFPAWEYITARVREQYPDTLFLLEGLGGKVSVTRRLLQSAGLNWAYSELFQQDSKEQVESYLPLAHTISVEEGPLVNFAETHDNNRLAAVSHAEARLRTAMAALFSQQGAFAFANGVEWFATEKIDVHGNSDLNWESPVNQVAAIARLTGLLRNHPAFYAGTPMRWVHDSSGSRKALALLRGEVDDPYRLLIGVNLNAEHSATLKWKRDAVGIGPGETVDLLENRTYALHEHDGLVECGLAPGAVLCLTGAPGKNLSDIEASLTRAGADREPDRVRLQRAVAKVQVVRAAIGQTQDSTGKEDAEIAHALLDDPVNAVERLTSAVEDILVRWDWPRDARRVVMLPPGHLLMVKADNPFRLELGSDSVTVAVEQSMVTDHGLHFALIAPARERRSNSPDNIKDYELSIRVYESGLTVRGRGVVRFLLPVDDFRTAGRFSFPDPAIEGGLVLRTNKRGAMMRASVDWGAIGSRYDALLAANLHPEHPVDRQVMLTRFRAWIEFRGHSHALDRSCLAELDCRDAQSVRWQFRGPFSPPLERAVELELTMLPDVNALRLKAKLLDHDDADAGLPTPGSLDLVLRPDIEDRNFHEDTLAFTGPEQQWPTAVHACEGGFVFEPHPDRALRLTTPAGVFVQEPEWLYQVPHPVEDQRGMRPAADLFSPGYFRIPLRVGEPVVLDAVVTTPGGVGTELPEIMPDRTRDETSVSGAEALGEILADALRAYIVRRGDHKTVIAGYPWFLDWGRDTLIVARGLLAAGMHAEVESILRQFALFEDHGTLPNMIRGDDARDRDTSDAPLWFVRVCADLMHVDGGRSRLTQRIDGHRSLFDVALNIVNAYRAGTANGIRVDAESGLVYSPAHFTWMDTNFPAATPRQGYPVEIQALWHAALRFLADMTADAAWRTAAEQVRQSVMEEFFLERQGYFSDCLHAHPGESARQARADDALRPNQLFLLNLDVVRNEPRVARRVLAACSELVVPGALRSLADRPVVHPMPVALDGRLLNDPQRPYWGRYGGDEDTRRKPAYHNGTAWGWLYPGYVEAWWKTYGPGSRPTVLALLGAVVPLLRRGCLMQLPEICDGDAPHDQRGCDAQAWSVSECYRVLQSVRG